MRDPQDLILLADFDPTGGKAVALAPWTGPSEPPSAYRGLPFVPALRACQACPARQEARQVVVGIGPADAVGMVIGQNPGVEEDQSGVPFVGAGGDVLNTWLKALGIDRAKLVITNALKCHTTNNRLPRPAELRACYEQGLSPELEALTALQVLFPVGKPAVAMILGAAAPPMMPLLAHHYLVRVTGTTTRDLHVFPLPHPAFLLRARHLGPQMQMVLTHVRLTLEREVPAAYAALR
jgi:uracil-DNA glycosylase family 4